MNFKHKNSAAVISENNWNTLPENCKNHFEESDETPTHSAEPKEDADGDLTLTMLETAAVEELLNEATSETAPEVPSENPSEVQEG